MLTYIKIFDLRTPESPPSVYVIHRGLFE